MGKVIHNTALAAAPATILPKRRGRETSGAASRVQLLPQRLSAALAAAFSNAVATVTVSLAGMSLPIVASAQNLPQGGQVVQGGATFQYNGQTLNVNTTNGAGNASAINWQSFNIGAGNTTNINQPNAQSTSLNRVVTANPSAIFGTLNSNGQVILVNQNGIAVGRGGVVDTAGFTASTLNISDADYAAGKLRFTGNALSGGVQVDGTIRSVNGDITLLAPNIATGVNALVKASNGSVVLGAGQEVEITGRGLEGVKFIVQSPSNTATNLGNLQGNAVGIFAGTLKHSGAITAQTATLQGGKVVLKALGDTVVSGSIDATGAQGANTQGGNVQILGGNLVDLQAGAVVDVSGDIGGGTILVGGGYQGKNLAVVNAQTTYVAQGAALQANARTKGDGGQVVVWADDTTRFKGAVSAKGGSQSGNGGNVETSGKKQLFLGGTVNTSAAKGKFGNWLLDPADLVIKGGARGSDPDFVNTFYEAEIESLQTNLTLQADNSITTTGAFVGGGVDLLAPGQSISLNVTASNGSSPAIAMSGVAINTNGGAVTVSVAGSKPGSINMGNVSTNSGAVNITSASNVDGSPGGQVNFGGIVNTNGGAISVSAGGINVGGGNALAYLDAAAGNINLQATSTAGINITSSGNAVAVGGKNITLTTDALTITGAADIGSTTTERVTIKTFSANNISLGGFTVPGVLGLSQAVLDRIKVSGVNGVLQIGDATTFSGNIFIAAPIVLNQSTVSLLTGFNGSITQAGAVDASTSNLRLEAGTVSLNDAGNKIAGYAGKTTRGKSGDFDVTTSNQNLLLNTIDGATGITSTGAVNLTSTFSGTPANPSTLSLGGDISSKGNVTIAGFDRIQLLKTTTIDTNTTNVGDSGNIDLGAATIFSSALKQGLVLDTSTGNGIGGSISIGSVTKSSGEFLNGIVLNSQGTSNGQINLTAGDITVGTGGVTLTGKVALSTASSITTNGGNVVISGSVDGPQKFFIDAGAGDVTIFAPMGTSSATAELKVDGKNISVNSINAVDATKSGQVISLNATGNLTVLSSASIQASTTASAPAPALPNTLAGIAMTAGGTLTVNGNRVQADGNIDLSGNTVAINSLLVDSKKGNIDIKSADALVIAGGAKLAISPAVNATQSVTLTSTSGSIFMDPGSSIVVNGAGTGNVNLNANQAVQLGTIRRDVAATSTVVAKVDAKNGISSAPQVAPNFIDVDTVTLSSSQNNVGSFLKPISFASTGPYTTKLNAQALGDIVIDSISPSLSLSVLGLTRGSGGSGQIALTSQGDVTILQAAAGGTGVNADNGNVTLTVQGLNKNLNINNSVATVGPGNIVLNADQGSVNISTIAAPSQLTQVQAGGTGAVTITANTLRLNDAEILAENAPGGAGLVTLAIDNLTVTNTNNPSKISAGTQGTLAVRTLTTGRSIDIVDNSGPANPSNLRIGTKDYGSAPGNGLVFKNLTIGDINTGNINISNGFDAGSGTVRLTAGANATIRDTSTTGGSQITANTLVLNAGGDIVNVQTNVANLSATSVAGDISVSLNYTDGLAAGNGTKFSKLSTAANKKATISVVDVSGGTIGQTAAINTAGSIEILSMQGRNLTWDNPANTFGQGVKVSQGNDIRLASAAGSVLKVSGDASIFALTGSDVELGSAADSLSALSRIRVNAAGNITQQNVVTVGTGGSANLAATGNIVLTNAGNVLRNVSLTGNTIDVANSADSNVGLINAQTNAKYTSTGLVQLTGTATAGGTLAITGNGGLDVQANVAAASVQLSAGNSVLKIGQGGANAVAVNGTNGVTLTGQTIQLLGGTGTGGSSSVSSAAGGITVNAAGNFVIQGGSGDNAYAQLLAAGPVTVTAGTVNINGGSGRGAYAKLDLSNAGAVLNINAGAVNLQGGGPGSYAAIVSNGDIVFTPGSSLSLVQGTGLDADATVLSFAGNVKLPTICNGCVRLTANPLGNNQTDNGVLGIQPPPVVIPPVIIPPVVTPPVVAPPVVITPPVVTTVSVVQTQGILNNLINPMQTMPGAGQDTTVIEGAICR